MSRQNNNEAVLSHQKTGSESTSHPMFKPYLIAIVILGLAAVVFSCQEVLRVSMGPQWIFLASLSLLTGTFTIKVPGTKIKISVAETFILTNLLLFGPAIGCLTAAIDGLLASIRCKSGSRRFQCMLFNMSVMGLSALGAGGVFTLTGGRAFLFQGDGITLEDALLPLASMAVVYYLINTIAVAVIVGLERGQSIYRVWRDNFFWLAANYLTAAVVAGLLALHAKAVTPAILWVVLAILVSSYFVCRNYVYRNMSNVTAAAAR